MLVDDNKYKYFIDKLLNIKINNNINKLNELINEYNLYMETTGYNKLCKEEIDALNNSLKNTFSECFGSNREEYAKFNDQICIISNILKKFDGLDYEDLIKLRGLISSYSLFFDKSINNILRNKDNVVNSAKLVKETNDYYNDINLIINGEKDSDILELASYLIYNNEPQNNRTKICYRLLSQAYQIRIGTCDHPKGLIKLMATFKFDRSTFTNLMKYKDETLIKLAYGYDAIKLQKTGFLITAEIVNLNLYLEYDSKKIWDSNKTKVNSFQEEIIKALYYGKYFVGSDISKYKKAKIALDSLISRNGDAVGISKQLLNQTVDKGLNSYIVDYYLGKLLIYYSNLFDDKAFLDKAEYLLNLEDTNYAKIMLENVFEKMCYSLIYPFVGTSIEINFEDFYEGMILYFKVTKEYKKIEDLLNKPFYKERTLELAK